MVHTILTLNYYPGSRGPFVPTTRVSGTKQNKVWPCRPVNWYAGWPGQAPVKHGWTVLGSYKHVHLDACAVPSLISRTVSVDVKHHVYFTYLLHAPPFQWDRRSVFIQLSSSRNCLVGTRVEPVVYVHNRHLQLRGNAVILIKPFSFFTSFKSELKQNINFDDLYFKQKYLLLHGWYTYIGSQAATNNFWFV